MNLISRAPLHEGGEGTGTGGPYFDVKRGAPGPRSVIVVIIREPVPFLIIVEEPEVAQPVRHRGFAGIAGYRLTGGGGMILTRDDKRIFHDRHLYYRDKRAFAG